MIMGRKSSNPVEFEVLRLYAVGAPLLGLLDHRHPAEAHHALKVEIAPKSILRYRQRAC